MTARDAASHRTEAANDPGAPLAPHPTRLEDLRPGASVSGVLAAPVTVISAAWRGSDAVELTYRTADGALGDQLLFRADEARLAVADGARPWAFDADGRLFQLAAEAQRIRLAHLFDPLLAVHTSLLEPLPHQITAVYQAMLPRQPLRFLLADDPGAGKTIMAGLLIKELMARGDLERCLIVCPGSLAEQWQDELADRFQLPFDILTRDVIAASRSGNWFLEHDLVIARLDKLSRDEDVQAMLRAPECRWDLVVCDEAHKMSATVFGAETKYTKRYQLGQLLSATTRHFLLMTATPHNGKEADFQAFMALIDPDRFEGRYRPAAHGPQATDARDLMRRMVKEDLYRFDGSHLFPPRIAYTVPFALSDGEAELYDAVTAYVRDEFNRADDLGNERRTGTVGFALTVLQRRLASSPEAILQSLRRRRERLEGRMAELEAGRASGAVDQALWQDVPEIDADDLADLDDAPEDEMTALEAEVLDEATASQTLEELGLEVATLARLEGMAQRVRLHGADAKWRALADLLGELFADAARHGAIGESATPPWGSGEIARPTPSRHQKLVVFTEHRDTLNYLHGKITTVLGDAAVVVIHGSVPRPQRLAAQEAFRNDPRVQVLLATDAAGEGINLQRAHLMVNYDLPWNPNRLEQRFGRIHRIGQTEVCHLWNLIAEGTREGEVYRRLLDKLEEARQALGGRVYDVLGKLVFGDRSLRDLLIEAIRFGENAERMADVDARVDRAADLAAVRELVTDHALVPDVMDVEQVYRVREDMERALARRLQPHFVERFFKGALERLGGTMRRREGARWEVTHVPAVVRQRGQSLGRRVAVAARYERVAFDKDAVQLEGHTTADLICPGHPLLDAVLGVTQEQLRDLLRRGTVLVDESDASAEPRVLFFLEHALQDAVEEKPGQRRVISQRMLYLELRPDGTAQTRRDAPYLAYRPLAPGELDVAALLARPECAWIDRTLEQRAMDHAVGQAVPEHLDEVRRLRQDRIDRTAAAVRARLLAEIAHLDAQANALRAKEAAGATNLRLASAEAQRRADLLQERLHARQRLLDKERNLSARAPVVHGGVLVVPLGMLAAMTGAVTDQALRAIADTQALAARAREIVMAIERGLGNDPIDVELDKVGFDIESRVPHTGRLRMIEVKGRVAGAETVTVTANEVLKCLTVPEQYILAIVERFDDGAHRVHYVRRPFQTAPDVGVTSVEYRMRELIARGEVMG